MPKGDSFPHESRQRLSPQLVAGTRPGNLSFLTLRPHSGGVNETARKCEQAVIPVADRKLLANKWGRRFRSGWARFRAAAPPAPLLPPSSPIHAPGQTSGDAAEK